MLSASFNGLHTKVNFKTSAQRDIFRTQVKKMGEILMDIPFSKGCVIPFVEELVVPIKSHINDDFTVVIVFSIEYFASAFLFHNKTSSHT
jgi:carbamate kinase